LADPLARVGLAGRVRPVADRWRLQTQQVVPVVGLPQPGVGRGRELLGLAALHALDEEVALNPSQPLEQPRGGTGRDKGHASHRQRPARHGGVG
jgi:hypothetical protein